MTAVDAHRGRPGLRTQLARFVLVGVLAAAVDFGTYQALLAAGVWVHLAKAASFVLGTSTAYLLNRRWTFRSAGGPARLAGFVLLYGTTFVINVGMNALALQLLPAGRWRITAAWLVAQATATLINFVVLRTAVFRR
ncbi:MAG TPA: GtrA family protein [Pseudonocardiaceae bacterium]